MQADDVDVLLAMCAEYFARRAECVARCRTALSDCGADLPVTAFLTAQFDQLDAAARHGAELVAAIRRERAYGLKSRS